MSWARLLLRYHGMLYFMVLLRRAITKAEWLWQSSLGSLGTRTKAINPITSYLDFDKIEWLLNIF